MKKIISITILSSLLLSACSQSPEQIKFTTKDTVVNYEVQRGKNNSQDKMTHPVELQIESIDEYRLFTFSYGPAYVMNNGERSELNFAEKAYDTYDGMVITVKTNLEGSFLQIKDAASCQTKLEDKTRMLYKNSGASEEQIEIYIEKGRKLFGTPENMVLSMFPEIKYYFEYYGDTILYKSKIEKEQKLRLDFGAEVDVINTTEFLESENEITVDETTKMKNEKKLLNSIFNYFNDVDIAAGKGPLDESKRPKKGKLQNETEYTFDKGNCLLISVSEKKLLSIDGNDNVSTMTMKLIN